jgi:hypothetical protein
MMQNRILFRLKNRTPLCHVPCVEQPLALQFESIFRLLSNSYKFNKQPHIPLIAEQAVHLKLNSANAGLNYIQLADFAIKFHILEKTLKPLRLEFTVSLHRGQIQRFPLTGRQAIWYKYTW